MPDLHPGRAWIELDRAALRHNVELLKERLPAGCALMPAVKANAYGHGAVLIARELNALGIDAFCVATVREGAELRQNGVRGEILILGYTHPGDVPLLRQYRLIQTVVSLSHALELEACAQDIRVHIKLDTGMHRLGVRCEHPEEIRRIFDCGHLHVTGAYTHLYADDLTGPEGREAALEQSGVFYRTAARLKQMGCIIPKVHISASGGLLHRPEIGGSYARAGIAIYGLLGTKEELNRAGVDLRPVLSLKARIVQVKNVFAGEGAGYGLRFRARRDARIAVVSIGYADGLPRGLSNMAGTALVRGCAAPVAGRVCMDMTLLDVTGIPAVSPGDPAVFIGKSGGLQITACDIAEQTGTISNEVLSRLGERLERRMCP